MKDGNRGDGSVFRYAYRDGELGAFARHGVRVIGWGQLGTDPAAAGHWTAAIIRDFGLTGFIADAEGAPYELSHDTVASRRYVETVGRELAGRTAELALSLPPREPGQEFDYSPWINGGWHFLPQCYENIGSSAVDLCVSRARRAWPSPYVHPTFGFYPWGGSHYVPLANYRTHIPAGTYGWSVFLSDYLAPADWAGLP